jgi:hypothetical protein
MAALSTGYGILCTIVKDREERDWVGGIRKARVAPNSGACEFQVRHSSTTPMPPPNLAAD